MGGKPINWQHWRKEFVQGGDAITLTALAKRAHYPAIQSLRNKSASEGWEEQRKRYRRELENRGVNLNGEIKPEVADAIDRTNKIIDTAEMLTQHNALAKKMLSLAAEAMLNMEAKNIKPSDVTQFMKVGVDMQRTIEGMATSKTEVDLKAATDAELDAIINGNA